MKRFWIEFSPDNDRPLPMFAKRGVGVTARSKEDALAIVRDAIFASAALPFVSTLIEDIDVSTLDELEIRPNMGNPIRFGIWFPVGFQQ